MVRNLFLVLFFLLLSSTSFADNEQVFNQILQGQIIITGNTLGLAKELDMNGPGIQDSIGTFISLESDSIDNSPLNLYNPWPEYTTNSWLANGSSAILTLPNSVEIVHAELVWGGSYQYGGEDVTAFLNYGVQLSYDGADISVVNPSRASTLAQVSDFGFLVNFYSRSADVTSYISEHGTGTYAVSAVPATQSELNDDLNAAGWALVVVYKDRSQPFRKALLQVGADWVDESSPLSYTVDSFCTPSTGNVEGALLLAVLEGDANTILDTVSLTVNKNTTSLSTTNNPADNFFGSQINDASGVLDTTGSFGNVNHDIAAATMVTGARQGWDITGIELSSTNGPLINNMTSLTVTESTTGDSFSPVLFGAWIDVTAPRFETAGSATLSEDTATKGDQVEVTLVLNNAEGEADALDSVLKLAVPQDITPISLEVGGTPVETFDLEAGVPLGNITAGETITIILTIRVDEVVTDNLYYLKPNLTFEFEPCGEGDRINADFFTESPSLSLISSQSDPFPWEIFYPAFINKK